MEQQLFGRLTTLNKLHRVVNDPLASKWDRLRADRAMKKIIAQLNDKKLMALRERLIKATRAGDLHEVWKIENQMRDYEGNKEGIELNE